MKKLLRVVADVIGIKTSYHVAYTYRRDSHSDYSLGDCIFTAAPWLHTENYRQLSEAVGEEILRMNPSGFVLRMNPKGFVITSITKIGP